MIGMNRTMGPASLITTRKKTPKRASSSTTTISASTRENHMELHSILRIHHKSTCLHYYVRLQRLR